MTVRWQHVAIALLVLNLGAQVGLWYRPPQAALLVELADRLAQKEVMNVAMQERMQQMASACQPGRPGLPAVPTTRPQIPAGPGR